MTRELVTYYMHKLYHQVEKLKRDDYDPGSIAIYASGYTQSLYAYADRELTSPATRIAFQMELHRQLNDLANNWQEPKLTISV